MKETGGRLHSFDEERVAGDFDMMGFSLSFELDYFNVLPLDSVFEHHYNKAPAVFDTLFPSHEFRRADNIEAGLTSIDPLETEPTQVPAMNSAPTATDAPAATAEPTTEPTDEPAPATVG